MTLNFMSVCPYCHKHVEPLRISDIMECPLCGGVSKLVIETVSDEPKMKKVRRGNVPGITSHAREERVQRTFNRL
jgi:DNA-directed RNA polymerase subunit RPC12/RpoP